MKSKTIEKSQNNIGALEEHPLGVQPRLLDAAGEVPRLSLRLLQIHITLPHLRGERSVTGAKATNT
jgi:hypothetical protein